MSISPNELTLLAAISVRPDTFDLEETNNPEKAKVFWGDLADRGYVKIDNFARCGFERIPGRFVSITEAGRAAVEKELQMKNSNVRFPYEGKE